MLQSTFEKNECGVQKRDRTHATVSAFQTGAPKATWPCIALLLLQPEMPPSDHSHLLSGKREAV